ncbi:MAG: flippase [Nanoarchaeota archaeon]
MAENEEVNKNLTILVKGSIVVFIGIFFSKFLTYFYKIIIARSFGPESYGLFSLALIIATLFSTVASLGLSEGLLRYASLYNSNKEIKKIKPLLKFSLIFSCFSSLIFATILFTYSDLIAIIFHDPSLTNYLVYFSIAIPFILISNLFLSIIKANMMVFRYTFIINILQNALRLFGLFLFILLGLKSHAIIGSYLLGIISIAIGSYFAARIYLSKIMSQKDIDSKSEKSLKREFISYSWPVIFVGFIGTVLYWIDSLVIGYLVDTTSVGIYGAAFTIVSLLGIAPELFMQMFLPVILKEYSKGRIDVIGQTSKQVSKWIGLLNIPAFTLMFIFPEIIINSIFGAQYLGASSSLRILAVGGFFSSFISLNTSLLSMKGKSKSILLTLIIASITNLVLSFFLVSSYGIQGAAITTSIIWFLTLVVLSAQVYKSTGIFAVRRNLVKIIILSIIPAVILVILNSHTPNSYFWFFIKAIIYGIIYITFIILCKSLDYNDYNIIRAFNNKLNLNILRYEKPI